MRLKHILLGLALSLPSFGQLMHSRWNPDVSGIFQCCPSDTIRINVILKNDPSVPLLAGPQTFTVYINGVARGGANLNVDGTFSLSDVGKPYQRTVSLGGLGGRDGQYDQDINYPYPFSYDIRVDGPSGTLFTKNVSGTNRFVFDYRYSIFVPTLVTVLYHTPTEYTRDVLVVLNDLKPQDPDYQGPTCSMTGGDAPRTTGTPPVTTQRPPPTTITTTPEAPPM